MPNLPPTSFMVPCHSFIACLAVPTLVPNLRKDCGRQVRGECGRIEGGEIRAVWYSSLCSVFFCGAVCLSWQLKFDKATSLSTVKVKLPYLALHAYKYTCNFHTFTRYTISKYHRDARITVFDKIKTLQQACEQYTLPEAT